MIWHTQLEYARFINCHKIAMNMVLLINGKRAKAFERPWLARHVEVSVASWFVLKQKERVMTNNYCNIIKRKKQWKSPTFGQTELSLYVGSVSVGRVVPWIWGPQQGMNGFLPFSLWMCLVAISQWDWERWTMLVALNGPVSPPTKFFPCPILFGFGEGRGWQREEKKMGAVGVVSPHQENGGGRTDRW